MGLLQDQRKKRVHACLYIGVDFRGRACKENRGCLPLSKARCLTAANGHRIELVLDTTGTLGSVCAMRSSSGVMSCPQGPEMIRNQAWKSTI